MNTVTVMVNYLENNLELLRVELMGEESIEPIYTLVAMFEWRQSERIAEEVFAYMNGMGSVEPVSTSHNKATRSMSVGDQLVIMLGSKAVTFTCEPQGWTTRIPGKDEK